MQADGCIRHGGYTSSGVEPQSRGGSFTHREDRGQQGHPLPNYLGYTASGEGSRPRAAANWPLWIWKGADSLQLWHSRDDCDSGYCGIGCIEGRTGSRATTADGLRTKCVEDQRLGDSSGVGWQDASIACKTLQLTHNNVHSSDRTQRPHNKTEGNQRKNYMQYGISRAASA